MIRMAKPKQNTAVIVGRFQVHELHPGHQDLLNWSLENFDSVIVVLGCPAINFSINNPLSYQARKKMLETFDPRIIVDRIVDRKDDAVWSKSLDRIIQDSLRPRQTPILIGARDSFIPHYEGTYPTLEVDSDSAVWSGTEVRKAIANMALDSKDFRAGVVYAVNGDWPRTIMTVDVAVLDKNREQTHIHLVRKHDETEWRFPGGFVEPGRTLEANAIRECREEVGYDEYDSRVPYVGSCTIDDWRYRGEDSAILTTMFEARPLWGGSRSWTDRAEIAEVGSFEVFGNEIEKVMVEEHRPLLKMYREYRTNKES